MIDFEAMTVGFRSYCHQLIEISINEEIFVKKGRSHCTVKVLLSQLFKHTNYDQEENEI